MRGRPFDTVAVTSPPLRLGWRSDVPGADTSPLPLSLQERGSPRPSMPRTKRPDRPEGRGVSHHCPRKGMRGAGWRASLPRADVECRCRGVDAAPISRRPAPRAGVLGVAAARPWRRNSPPLDLRKAAPATATPPETRNFTRPHDASRQPPWSGAAGGGRIGMARECGDKGCALFPVSA